jgi:hypothetical protein
VKDANDRRLFQAHDLAFAHRFGRRHVQRLSSQASLSQKFVIPQNRNNGFLAPRRLT